MRNIKFPRQLSLFMPTSKLSNAEMAATIPVSTGQFSNMKAGRRPTTKSSAKAITDLAHDFLLKLTAARDYFGTLGFIKRATRNDDFLGAIVQQKREEADRLNIQSSFIDAATTPKQVRDANQLAVIDKFMKELSEEIGSEYTLLDAAAKYLGVNAQDYVDEVNKERG
ncbi:hypothetical protein [Levilactobacillus sp. HBUAS70063]|uniref:hypothetical protein n=1 Tax=Levilactobacillus sp. HBUAS70063 TaxID=3109359 RepID=UPI003132AF2E